MKKVISIKEFFTTLGLGVWQFVCWVCKAFDPRHKTVFWRVIWAIWTALVLAFIGLFCFAYWHDNFRSREWEVTWLSNNVYLQNVYKGDDYVFNTKTGKKTVTGLINCYMPAEGDSLAVFFKDGKRGYLDIYTGEIALPAVYDQAWVFSDGVAMVVKDDSLHVINSKGEYLAAFWYSRRMQIELQVDYVFNEGQCIMNTADNKFGVVNKKGEWVVPAEYETIYRVEYGAEVVYNVSKKDAEHGGCVYGVIDLSGNELIPCIYKSLSMDEDAGIFVTDAQHYQWKTDLHGNISDEPLCYNVTHLEYTVKQTVCPTDGDYGNINIDVDQFAPLYSYTSSSEGYMGLMDANGHRITPPIYRSIKAINDNLYCCGYDNQFDNAVLVNAKGVVVE